MAKILLVEDEALVGELAALNLERAGHEVKHAVTFREGLAWFVEHDVDLAIVDGMLPDGTGFDLVARARAAGKRCAVMMLTALSDAASKVRGLDSGADDYLAKPFDVGELQARVRALLRRSERPTTAVLLVNVGSPASPSPADVRRYLAEFLSDPRVIDSHPVVRWLLLHGIILRTRPKKSAALYQTIWTEEGSPLIVHSHQQAAALQRAMPDVLVAEAMRYGEPSLDRVISSLVERGIERLLVVPLYPQYSLSATETAIEAVQRALLKHPHHPRSITVAPFYDDAGFIKAYAQNVNDALSRFDADTILFSYHGLPKHQITACDKTRGHCFASEHCCDAIVEANANCYRAQAYATTRLMMEHIPAKVPHETAFQSRLKGRPWIEPFADARLVALGASGVKRLLVVCPSFVTDCLETLDEVGHRFKAQFIAAGGEDLCLVPALNAGPQWISALERLCRKTLAGGTVADGTVATIGAVNAHG